MTKVRLFYNEQREYILLAQILLKKILPNEERAVVVTDSEGESEKLNQFLWTYEDTAFLPHCLATGENADNTPVVITYSDRAEDTDIRDYMIVLGNRVPNVCESYANLVVITKDGIEANNDLGNMCADMERRGFQVQKTDRAS